MISEHPCTEDGWDVVSEDWWLTAPDFTSWSFPETALERERWTTRYKKPPHRPQELLSASPGLKPSASLSPAESGERLSDTLLGVTRAEDTLRSYEAQERIADDCFPTEPLPFPALDEDAPEVAYRSWCEQVEALFDGIQDEPPVPTPPSSPPCEASTPRPRRQRRQVSDSTSSTSSSPFSLDFSPTTSTTSLFPSEAASSQTSLPSRSPSPKPLDLSDADWPALTSTPACSRLRKDSEGYYALASPSPSPRKKREAASRTRTLVDRIRSQDDRTRDTDLAAIERKLNQYKDLSSLVLDPEPETEPEPEPEPELEQKPYVDWRAVTSGVKNVFGASMPGPGFDDDDDLHMLQLELDDETGKPRTTHDLVASFFQTPKPAPAEAQLATPLFQPASPSVVEIRAPPPKTRRSRKERRSEGWIEGPREGWIGMEKPAAPPVAPLVASHQRSASVLSGRVPLSTKLAPPLPPMFTQPFGPAYPGYAYPYPVPVVYQYAPTGLMAIPLGATQVQVPVLPLVPVTITGTSGIRHAV